MRKLYKSIKKYNSGKLKVSDLHIIYFEEYGNPKGRPVVSLHGGPGSSSKSDYARIFNPKKFRIIFFDQRGCGKSTPAGEIKENTIQDLVGDIEKLRVYLDIKKWRVAGASWGSTLALAYAETHPEKTEKLFVRGIFLFEKKEIDWMFGSEAAMFYPDAWEIYSRNFKTKNPDEIANHFYNLIFGRSEKKRLEAIKDFYFWNAFRRDLIPGANYQRGRVTKLQINSARIFFHYVKNRGFLEKKEILNNVYKIKNIPGIIIHGRYDMICPLDNAWRLHKAWSKSKLKIVDVSGHHSAGDEMVSETIIALDKF